MGEVTVGVVVVADEVVMATNILVVAADVNDLIANIAKVGANAYVVAACVAEVDVGVGVMDWVCTGRAVMPDESCSRVGRTGREVSGS